MGHREGRRHHDEDVLLHWDEVWEFEFDPWMWVQHFLGQLQASSSGYRCCCLVTQASRIPWVPLRRHYEMSRSLAMS